MASTASDNAASSSSTRACFGRRPESLLEDGLIEQRHLKHGLLSSPLGGNICGRGGMFDYFVFLHNKKKIIGAEAARAILGPKHHPHQLSWFFVDRFDSLGLGMVHNVKTIRLSQLPNYECTHDLHHFLVGGKLGWGKGTVAVRFFLFRGRGRRLNGFRLRRFWLERLAILVLLRIFQFPDEVFHSSFFRIRGFLSGSHFA